MQAVTIDLGATPSQAMAYLASLAGSKWIVESANEQMQRVTLRTSPAAFSFGIRVQASLLQLESGSRVILEGSRVVSVNFTANPSSAVVEIGNLLRQRFPQRV